MLPIRWNLCSRSYFTCSYDRMSVYVQSLVEVSVLRAYHLLIRVVPYSALTRSNGVIKEQIYPLLSIAIVDGRD